MDTTRTYPRTLGEAFKGVDYACAVERTASRGRTPVVLALLALCLLLIGVTAP